MCKINSEEKLSALWPYMKREILRLREKNPPRMHWIPEHVRKDISLGLAGQSQLECFVAHDAPLQAPEMPQTDTVNGILICYPKFDPFVSLPLTWFVWLMVAQFGVLAALLPEFETIARARGYLHWEFSTARKGWARRAQALGLKEVEYILAKDL